MFLVDEESGVLNAYDWEVDRWRTVVEAERLKGTLQMAAGGDRCVCVSWPTAPRRWWSRT